MKKEEVKNGIYHTRTLKLKLSIVSDDKKATWQRVRQISNDAWKAANWIVDGQYLNDMFVRRIYDRRKIDPKDNMESVSKVEGEFFSKDGYFGTKRQATTERDVKGKFPNLPSCVTNPLNQVVVSSYRKEKGDMLAGNRSLRSYRKGMPIQTTKTSIEFCKDESLDNHHHVIWKLNRKEYIEFKIYYGKDRANNKLTIDRVFDGINKYCAPMLQLKDKDLFLLLPVQEPQKFFNLDTELSLGVDLGVSTPAYVAMSKGKARKAIGFKEDFLRVRLQMQSRLCKLQKSIKLANGGHGRKKKIKALERIKNKERYFARTYNHYLSKEIVDFAIKNRAGVIKLEMLEGFGKEEQHSFVLRNWSFFELQGFVTYKAKAVGIKVVKIDPYHTSQTCSACGHYEQDQRKERDFICKSCGEKFNSDHNAAVNIAMSDKIVTKKEQCEYYKLKTEFKKTRLGSQPEGEGVPLYIIHSPTSHVQQMGVA